MTKEQRDAFRAWLQKYSDRDWVEYEVGDIRQLLDAADEAERLREALRNQVVTARVTENSVSVGLKDSRKVWE